MRAQLSSLLPLLASSSLVSALESPLPDHDLQEQVWTVPITPGGPTVTINGTVQQLFAQLTKLNPNYEAEFPPQTPDIGQPRTGIDKRDLNDHKMGRYSCAYDFYGVGLGYIRSEHVERGLVEYLDKVPGHPKLAPDACSKVSCDLAQGVFWCNHGTSEKVLENFKVIADAAREVIKLCKHGTRGDGAGQIEFQDHWSVIYRADAQC
ncbi:hypothetical protein CONLIGDRAFT_713713 [Coniochaeta ligniaria NRRL 30616]|uniref:Ecp2 effector protein domain-containing protein n=1 Tax=Coniochaeta ligniaria NRRL 30616 TaxID=1408157 RepID=A0A1J7IUA9_9PEZI|nr:hypothetical protein CONLIGDRAFT_713713 [Coniochaeta ligniaria NRRL 30616]